MKKIISLFLILCLLLPFAFAVADSSEMAAYTAAEQLEEKGFLEEALYAFADLGDYKDSARRADQVRAKLYDEAEDLEDGGYLDSALHAYTVLGSYKDSAKRIDKIREKQITLADKAAYARAEQLEKNGQLEAAENAFLALSGYSDSASRASQVREKINARAYAAAEQLENNGRLEEAESAFRALSGYSDSPTRASQAHEKILAREYAAAEALEKKGDPVSAYEAFLALGSYSDSPARAAALKSPRDYAVASAAVKKGDLKTALQLFTALGDYEDSADKAYTLGVIRFANTDNRGSGVAAFRFHDLWGLINVPKNTVVSPRYGSIGQFDGNGLAIVELKGKYGCIDTEGHVIVPCEYEQIGAFTEGLAKVKKNGKYGYVNTQGLTVIACEWAEISPFSDGLCTVAKAVKGSKGTNYLYGLYRKDGTPLTEAKWRTLGASYNTDWNAGKNSEHCARPVFTEGFIEVQTENGLWGYMKPDGTMLAEPVYGALSGYAYGLCAAQKDKLWGYIDRDGHTVIQHLYSEAKDFTPYGFAEVLLPKTGWQVIDKNGSLLYFINEQHKYDYEAAVRLMEAEQYQDAYELLIKLEGYADSNALAAACFDKMHEAEYAAAGEAFAAGRFEEALAAYEALRDYRDSAAKAEECREAIKEQTYRSALDLVKDEKYGEALALFESIPGYKDVDTLLKENAGLQKAMWSPGHYVFFGSYEQDNDTKNGKEPIEWLVLEQKGDTVLLISRYGLDAKPYHNQYRDITWEQCSLRQWLNRDFLNAAFSREEQARIQNTDVDNSKAQHPKVSTNGGRNTKDRVYLLSYAEAKKYFNSDQERVCMPTAYAKNNGVSTNNAGACWWWLRSPGDGQDHASGVHYDGYVQRYGNDVDRAGGCVRPVIWVKIAQ